MKQHKHSRIAVLVAALFALLAIAGCGGGGGFSAPSTPTPTAHASVSATTVEFGDQPVNTPSAAHNVTISNTGNATLTISQITAAVADYSQTNSCGTSLAAGSSCTVSIVFTPSAMGARNSTLVITDSAAGSPHSVALTGSGAGPGISLSTTSLNFGNQLVNAAAPAQSINVTNNGTAPLSINYIGASGDFSDSDDCGSSLTAGSTCTIHVVFTPSATGTRTGTVTVADNATGSPHSITLAGVGVAPVMSLSTGGGSLNFPNQVVNTTSAPRTVTVTNTGNTVMNLSSIVASGDYAQANDCGSSLAINASCTVSVTFTPTATGLRSGSLTLSNDSIGSPQSVPLTGTGIAANVTFSSGSVLNFPTPQLINTTSAPESITVTNNGSAPLNISGIVATGDYAQTNNCGTSLAIGASCTINITFTPTGGGTRTGSLSIIDDAPGSPQTVTLTGTGLAPSLSAAPSSVNFGDQLVGTTTAPVPVTLTNNGSAVLTLTGITISGDYAQTNNCPTTLNIGASCIANITFTPTVTGVRAGSLIVSQSIGAPFTVVLTGNGVVPVVTFSNGGGTLNFPNQPLNTTSDPQTLTLTNSGTAPLTITSITATGAFAETNNCGTSLAAGATCTINVTFTPTNAGTNSGGVTLIDNAPGSPQTVNLSGTGVAPLVSFSISSIDFGSVLLGTTPPPQSFVLTNSGSAPLNVSSITAAGDYSQTNNCGTSLAAGSTCTVNVSFNPTTTGVRSGSVTVADNAAGSPHVVNVTATVTAPGVSFSGFGSGSTLTFADQLLNTTSSPQTVTLTNSGTAPLAVNSISISGDYAQTNNCAASLAPAASCSINVTFTPTVLGTRAGTLTIADDAPGHPHTLAITGKGVMPVVTLSQTSITFTANQLVGTTSSAQIVTLNNTGGSPLDITSITITGDYSQTNNCGTSLNAGAACNINITFSPTATGTRTGTLTLTDSAGNSPQTVSLSGTAIAPAVTLSPTSLTFPSTVLGNSSAPMQIQMTNSGNAVMNISGITASTGYSQTNNCGSGLGIGSSCFINVTFTPTFQGLMPGTLNIFDNAAGSPQQVTLSGVGKVLTSILVIPNNPTVPLGFNQTFTALGNYSDHSSQTITNSVTWDSSDHTVATVNSSGVATSLLQGTTTITAALGAFLGSSTLTVGPPELVQITITPTSALITRGDTLQLTATGTYSDNSTADISSQVAWSSSNPTAVTVSNTGLVTGVSVGLSTITASLGTATITADIRVSAPVGTPRFAFVANQSDNTISIYTIDGNTGKLHNVSYTVAGTSPSSLAVAPSGNFLYVLDTASNSVAAYAIAATTGALTPIPGSPYATGNTPAQLTLDPSGTFLFVSNANDNTISVFTADSNTGALTPVAGSPFTAGLSPAGMAVDTFSKYLYVANLFGNNISTYSIAANGALTEISGSPVATSTMPNSVIIEPSGKYVYATNSGVGSVSGYSTNNGLLTPITGSPFLSGAGPVGMAVDPTGQYAYTANSLSNSVSQFTINVYTGALAKIGTGSVPAGANPSDIIADSSGKYLYVSDSQSNDVTVYSIDSATGRITNLQTVRARPGPASVAVAPGSVTGQYTPRFGYVANRLDNNIFGYNIDSAGNLSVLPNSPFVTDVGPRSLAVDFTGSVLFSVNYDAQNVTGYNIDPVTGALTAVNNSPFAAGSFPAAMAVDPSGRFAYVANFASNNISGYLIDPFMHSLIAMAAPFAAGSGADSITIDPTGQFAYAACSLSNSVYAYKIDATTGSLNPIAGSPYAAGTNPVFVTVDPTGKFAYVANFATNNISGYVVDPFTGALTQMGSSPFAAGTVPTSIAVDPTGRFAYVTSSTGNIVQEFLIDATSGALTSPSGTSFAATNQNPSSVIVDPSGHYAYVTNSNSGNVSAYNLDLVGGAPTAMTNSPFPAGTSPQSMVITGSIAQGFSISGTITPALNASGMTVQLSGTATATTTVDAFGNFSFTDLQPGSYTVTPVSGSYTITPANLTTTISNTNITGTNFTAN